VSFGRLADPCLYSGKRPRGFIVDADNVRPAFLIFTTSGTKCIQSRHPLSFSGEGLSQSADVIRLGSLISELRSTCNEPRHPR
jgi:hypothetical protein